MGFFNRFAGKKSSPASAPASKPAASAPSPPPEPSAPAGNVLPRLAAARERLEAKDLPGALAIYEEVLAAAGERADVLVTIWQDGQQHWLFLDSDWEVMHTSYWLIVCLFLTGCTTPSQWCVGSCTQQNPTKEIQK